jgi:hypothetical protein
MVVVCAMPASIMAQAVGPAGAEEAVGDRSSALDAMIVSHVEARIFELPTIPGLVPTIASKWIDDGMRSGIPREDWAAVVTLYGGAAKPVAALTGTEFPRRTRVLVLDETGKIVRFDDEGYAVRKSIEVADLVGQREG